MFYCYKSDYSIYFLLTNKIIFNKKYSFDNFIWYTYQ